MSEEGNSNNNNYSDEENDNYDDENNYYDEAGEAGEEGNYNYNSNNNRNNYEDGSEADPNNPNIGISDEMQPLNGYNLENNNDNNNENNENNVSNDSIRSYDEDEDFPVYANRINKKLNQIIKNYKQEIRKVNNEIDENRNMVQVLDEHTKSVEQQVKNKEMTVNHTTENIELEEHTIQTIERQIGKLRNQKKILDEQEVDLQERLNSIQFAISKANEKMDNYKLNMKDKLEELEQWALAARQKEDDNLNLEKYKKLDDMRIKELMLHIERLTLEVNRKMAELEREVTETQAAQIEMERTTEELKKLQNDRQDILEKLLKTEEQIKQRHEELKVECDTYFNNKTYLTNLKADLDARIETLNNNTKLNKQTSEDLKKKESDLFKARDYLNNFETKLKDMQNDIQIKKNELSALARELTNKTNLVNFYKNELEQKRKKLDQAKADFNNKKVDLNANQNVFKTAKQAEEEEAKQNDALEKEAKQKHELLDRTVNDLYEKSKRLFELREQEANMIGEINNIISAKKNLKANINKLIQEITKQMGLLYDVDFQIQLMERKVAWVLGKRTQEETNEINNEIETLEKSKADRQKKLNKLLGSLKNIDEELRNVETRLKTAKEEKKKLTDVIEELELENIKSGQDLQKISKRKEETLVEHDLMKLEIKNLYDKLVAEANHVFKEENKLYQLELSIKEREKEIQVHREILIAEHKAAEEERHKTAMELSHKITRANNLKLKYDSIVQKNKKTGDDDKGIEEHSQAYYVIKTAQEKEELQRLKDEMDGKIKKCKKDLNSLYRTLGSLKSRNEKLKTSLIVKKNGELHDFKRQELEEKVSAESEQMWAKKKELEALNASIEQGALNLKEKSIQINVLKNNLEDFQISLEKIKKEVTDKEEKFNRSDKRNKQVLQRTNLNMESDLGYEIQFNNEILRNKFLKNAITILCSEIPEMKSVISGSLQEVGVEIASRPTSEKAVSAMSSSGSRRSGR